MGYDQYTVSDDCTFRIYFCCFPLALANTFPRPFVPILSNFFKEQCPQSHPQYLSGLSRALFPTTFLEIAVYTYSHTEQFNCKLERKFSLCTLVMKTYTPIFILNDLVWPLLLLLVFQQVDIVCRENWLSNPEKIKTNFE